MQNWKGRAFASLPGLRPGLIAATLAVAVALGAPGGAAERLALAALAGAGSLLAAAVARRSAQQPAAQQPAKPSDGTLSALADAVPAILWCADALGTMQWLSARWRSCVAAPPDAARWPDAVHPDDAAGVARVFAERVPRGEPFEFELRLRTHRPGDGFHSFLALACPMRDDAGAASGWCGVFVDVDERQRRERALAEADRRKDEFLAVLGHELRNPLAAIRSALSITSQRGASPEQAGAARRVVERQIAHMVRLIDDLLDVNRVVGGHVELHRQPLDVADALRAAVEARREVARERRQPLTVELPEQPVAALADRARLEQVFVNLLGNASKYSERGSAIRVTLERDGDSALVRFEDRGIGIAPRDLQRVFDPFVQLEPARAREDGGLGIGLTLVRHLIELHGGRVEAASEGTGRGSVFTVCLPALPVATADTSAESPLYRARPRSQPRRILVVDDNADSAQSLATLLSIQGHEVRTAGDGMEGLTAAESFRPEVVLLDIGMPRMDGYETARRLRAGPHGQSMLLLALTGWSHDEDRTRSREAGFDEHLVKPVDPELLGRVLLRAPAARLSATTPL